MPAPIRPKDALDYHSQGRPGKIEVVPTKPSVTQRDLSLAYSPGVAEPCRAIFANRDLVDKYTARGNLIGVVSNGTAVLGLGDIGPYAAKPVMEGKGMLFKKFADIDVFDIEIDEKDPDKLIETIVRLEPTFGGINLEDIKAPECFYIEQELRRRMSIPVFHDDQHGTAIITGAALLNACNIAGKTLTEIQVVCCGAGAAAVRCMELWVALGVPRANITMLDRLGVVYTGRVEEMDPYKGAFAQDTPQRTLAEAIVGKDVFIGLSIGNIVTGEMLKTMAASSPIIFALANPDPEVPYEIAVSARPDAIVATGRSDYPNQVNNVLGYPYIFRGALDVRATTINEEMKLAATRALAELAQIEVPERIVEAYGLKALRFGRSYIIPKPFDERVLLWVAPAVAQAAMDSGVARQPIDIVEYTEKLARAHSPTRMVVRQIFAIAKSSPKRIVFPEGEQDKIIRAAGIARDEGFCIPILLGKRSLIEARAQELDIDLAGVEIVNPDEVPDRDRYIDTYWTLRRRKGVTRYGAQKLVARERKIFGMLMVHLGDADGCVSGLTSSYAETIRPALQVIGLAPGYTHAAGMYMMVKGKRVLFCADTTVNEQPDASTLSEIAIACADAVYDLGLAPRVAMLSYSNFGSASGEEPRRVAEATAIVKRKRPDIMVDGEMQADVALEPLLREEWSFSELEGAANVLVFPSLAAGNIAYKLLSSFGGAEAIGPILLGMRKPVTVLQRNSAVDAIVNMAAITAAAAVRQASTPRANTLPPPPPRASGDMATLGIKGSQMKVVAAGRTHVGRKREHNEDQLLVLDALSLYVVADGMGGHKAGDIASALAVKSIENFFAATAEEFDDPQPDGLANLRSARRLRASIEKANRDVHQISSHYPQHKGMGSTVVGFCVDKKEKLLHVAHVGDSRCYRLRDGHLEQLTRDHSLVNDIRALQNKGANVKLTNLPKNVITRALGMKATVEVDLRTEQIREGDVYLICSDGLTGMVPDEQIAEVFLIEEGVEGAADILIDMANDAGGTDNITVVIVKIDGALCGKCGAVMIEGSAFCGHCGQRVEAT